MIGTPETRDFPIAPRLVRAVDDTDGDSGTIQGYAAVYFDASDPGTEFYLLDDLVEQLMPGCFDQALRDGDDCVALFNHDPNNVLGRRSAGTMRLVSDKRGLAYTIKASKKTTTGRDVVEHLRRGDVAGSSFSFLPVRMSWKEEGRLLIRCLEEVRVLDVGPVCFPAYASTTAGLRSRSKSRHITRDQVLDRARQVEIDQARPRRR